MPREYQFPFELRHLIYFRELAKELHFRKAAEQLSLAQPALSRQIRQFEEMLGAPLFLRSQRKVELTAEGTLLLERIEPLLRKLAQLPEEVRSVSEGRVGHIRVGFTGLAMASVLPGILREFHRKYPGIRVELNESPTSRQTEALRAGGIDCGFMHPDQIPEGFETIELLRERNGVLLPMEHPLAGREQLRLQDLAETPFVLFPRHHNAAFYDRILSAFASSGIAPHIAEEVWPRANGVGLVRAGLGVTFITPSEARQLPEDVVFRPLLGPAPESRLVLAWLEETDQAPLRAFVAITQSLLLQRSQSRLGD